MEEKLRRKKKNALLGFHLCLLVLPPNAFALLSTGLGVGVVFSRTFLWLPLTFHERHPVSASDAQTLITPLPRQLASTCGVPALSTLLTAWLHGTLQLSALPGLPIYTNTPVSPPRTSSLDPRLSLPSPSTDRPFTDVCCQTRTLRSWRASRRPQSRAWTFSGGRPASGLVRFRFH